MATVEVIAGVCGFKTTISSSADDMFEVTLAIQSDCPQIRKLAEALPQVSALQELRVPINESVVYRLAGPCRLHAACPVPSAILKAIEVATGMALPADVHMSIRQG
ncbi:MAG: DUF6951 family protein [Anaerolineae bacterium]